MIGGGLTSKEAEELLCTYGRNEVPVTKESLLKKIILKLFSPISLMLIVAAILSLIIDKIFDFYFILALFAINFIIEFWQEKKADNAIEKLSSTLCVKTKTLRNGKWTLVDSRELVPSDVVELVVGDLITADMRIDESVNLSINESSLTGESLPKEKNINDVAFSGSYVTTGLMRCTITHTGINTSFSKQVLSIEKPKRRSVLEQDILVISKFLMFLSIICIVILTIIFLIDKKPLADLAILDLSLLIAGIPVALPVVMSLITSIGVIDLAKKNAVIRRLSSLEDLSNVNILLTDKTGTITKNRIDIEQVITYSNKTAEQIICMITPLARKDDKNAINQAILRAYDEKYDAIMTPELIEFIPADSERKRAFCILKDKNSTVAVTIGAPQIIRKLCVIDLKTAKRFNADISDAAKKGCRVLAIATKKGRDDKKMRLVGIILLSDPPLEEAKEVIAFLKENNIYVVMQTGDNEQIAKKVCEEVGLEGVVISKNDLQHLNEEQLRTIAAFAEILPKDKQDIVKRYQLNNTVAVTGDGINDLPAMETANVSIAVHNSADALKGSADIILLSDGISVISDAVIESRKIFSRLYTYSVYRLAESFRIIFTILILGIFIGDFPLTPIQLILLAFLNDLPIITLAFNKVKLDNKVRKINVKDRFMLSSIFGVVGILNSLLFYILAAKLFHLDISTIQTLFFLKLTVSGHLLIFVAHTSQRWYKFLPSYPVIIAIITTQLFATTLAFTGILMSAKLSIGLIALVWVWAIVWMQIGEYMKYLQQKITSKN